MAYEHESGLPFAYARAKGRQEVQGAVFHGKRTMIQGASLNDVQDIVRGRHDRLGRLIAKNGDRTEGAFAVVDRDAGTVTLTAGKVFVAGDEFPVAEKIITGVAMVGRVEIGVRLVREWITGDDDPSLRGLVPGSLAEDEEGAGWEIARVSWALASDGAVGEFNQVYLLQDGTILDQSPPPMLAGVRQAIADYDRPFGHYIVSGNRVTALGANGGRQHFAIEEGEANISGFKNVRYAALRIAESEVWDVGAVPGETHTITDGVSQTIYLNKFPLDQVTSILLTKERTVNVTRGVLANGIDGLPENSVLSITSIVGFVQGADYILTGNGVDWAPLGNEPLSGASYSVTFRYRESVSASDLTDKSLVVSGGAVGGEGILSYTYKLPRVDIIGLLANGEPVYVHGVSALADPVMPIPPGNVLPLCEVHNDWMNTPRIVVDGVRTGVRMMSWAEQRRLARQQENMQRLAQLERLRSDIDRRDPVAKKNTFVDPFENDYYRDAGEPQTGAVGNGILQLAIEPTFYDADLTAPVLLDWVEEVIVEQKLKTGCVKINQYLNYAAMPGSLELTPAVDFWTVPGNPVFTSPETIEFQRGVQSWGGPLTSQEVSNQVVGRTEELLPMLRQRDIDFTLAGFWPGEILTELTFDGVSVMPVDEQVADADGEIAGSFTIPEGITAGTKSVRAAGAVDGTVAEALFTGQGTLAVDIMRRVTTINRWVASAWLDSGLGSSQGRGPDPQAQLFLLPNTRQLVGVDFHLCAIGDTANHLLIHQVAVENGFPTESLEAEAFVSMIDAVEGWKSARYKLPATTTNDRDRAFVIKTDDGGHAISFAKVGEFDAELQRPVSAHPYAIAPRASSVNARSWSLHQDEALAFRLVAARYPVTTKTVQLGSFDLVDCSDLQVRAVVELPSQQCSVVFELERTNGTIYRLLPLQVLSLSEYITEKVTLRAVLTGTNILSPILYAPVELVAGKIATEATYVSRAFDVSTADRVSAYLKVALPAGSTMAMAYDHADGVWSPLPLDATEISPDPAWVEQNHREGDLAASLMRIKITLTGGPGARPRAADLGLGAM